MRIRSLLFVFFVMCFLLTACQAAGQLSGEENWEEHTSASTEEIANQVPEELRFFVSCVCDLTDSDGKTLHSGGAFDFYGTIEATPGHMIYGNPTMFEFTVPYSDSYTFQAETNEIVIDTWEGNYSKISCSGYNEIVWRLDGWSVKGLDADVSVEAVGIDAKGNRFFTTLSFHTLTDAEISLTQSGISVTGLQGESTVSIWDAQKLVDSETLTIPAQGDTLTLDLSELSNSSFAVTTGGESTEMQVTWLESEA